MNNLNCLLKRNKLNSHPIAYVKYYTYLYSMKQIKSNPNYFISEEGIVFRNNKPLKPSLTNNGYFRLALYLNGVPSYVSIHRLVAETYIDNPNKHPFVNHLDGNKQNNHYSNLEWCDNSHNLKHAYRLGLKSAVGENNGRNKITKDIAITIKQTALSGNMKLKDIALKYNVSNTLVSEIKRGIKWNHI